MKRSIKEFLNKKWSKRGVEDCQKRLRINGVHWTSTRLYSKINCHVFMVHCVVAIRLPCKTGDWVVEYHVCRPSPQRSLHVTWCLLQQQAIWITTAVTRTLPYFMTDEGRQETNVSLVLPITGS